MGESLYRKVGRKYQPIAWYEDTDTWPEGATLLVVTRDVGCTSMQMSKLTVDVNVSHLLTLMALKSRLADAIRKAQEPEMDAFANPKLPKSTPLTKKQYEAAEAFRKAFKKKSITMEYPRLEDVIDGAICEVMNWGKTDATD